MHRLIHVYPRVYSFLILCMQGFLNPAPQAMHAYDHGYGKQGALGAVKGAAMLQEIEGLGFRLQFFRQHEKP